MKCRYCKAEIPEGELYCKKCGREVQIVPDYNPLEEMLGIGARSIYKSKTQK